jgi:hypothetical protein
VSKFGADAIPGFKTSSYSAIKTTFAFVFLKGQL